MATPRWFTEFVDKQFKPFTAKIEADVADLKVRMTKVENRLDNLAKKNSLVE